MISPETRVQIRRYFYAEHWKIGTIAQALDVHPDTVRRAIEVERFQHAEPLRPSMVDPYLPFVREVLEQYPRLRATRLHQMIRDRGYSGSVEQLRRVVARLRPQPHEAFAELAGGAHRIAALGVVQTDREVDEGLQEKAARAAFRGPDFFPDFVALEEAAAVEEVDPALEQFVHDAT